MLVVLTQGQILTQQLIHSLLITSDVRGPWSKCWNYGLPARSLLKHARFVPRRSSCQIGRRQSIERLSRTAVAAALSLSSVETRIDLHIETAGAIKRRAAMSFWRILAKSDCEDARNETTVQAFQLEAAQFEEHAAREMHKAGSTCRKPICDLILTRNTEFAYIPRQFAPDLRKITPSEPGAMEPARPNRLRC